MDVVVTGGLGFIGSNLAKRLVSHGHSVTIIDAQLPEYGANMANVASIKDDVRIVTGDVRDNEEIEDFIKGTDIVFHLAGQLSRTISMEQPAVDAAINCGGTLNVLSRAAGCPDPPQVVFTSSQAVLGKPAELPMGPATEPKPVDVYGANKLAAEQYCSLYNRLENVATTIFRLTNVYGPRAQLSNPNYGVINRFLKRALEGKQLPVFEPGETCRDFLFIDDVVDALVESVGNETAIGETYFIGSGRATSIKELADRIVEVAGTGSVELVPWEDDWEDIRVGDLVADYSKTASHLDWESTVDLEDGIRKTLDYYRYRASDYDLDLA